MKNYKNPSIELLELLTREDILTTSVGIVEIPEIDYEEKPNDTPPISLI